MKARVELVERTQNDFLCWFFGGKRTAVRDEHSFCCLLRVMVERTTYKEVKNVS